MASDFYTGVFNGNQIKYGGNTPTVQIGQLGDKVVMGDWDGDGRDTPAIFRGGTWILDATGNGIDDLDKRLQFGFATDKPVAGDWNGDGRDTVGVFRNGLWYFDHNGDGYTSDDAVPTAFGFATDKPVVGDWNGDGRDTPGIFRAGTWVLDETGNGYTAEDRILSFGFRDSQPISGDWNGDGRDSPGVLQINGFVYDWEGNGYTGEIAYPNTLGDGVPVAGNGIYRPMQGAGIEFAAKGVQYNGNSSDKRATVTFQVSNPKKVAGDMLVRLYWSSGPNLNAPFVQPAGEKVFSNTRSGGKGLTFSGLEVAPRPAQATHLIAVVNGDHAVPEANQSNNTVATQVPRKLYLNFNGATITNARLREWAGDDWPETVSAVLDRAGDGIQVNRFLSSYADRNAVIQGIVARLQQDLSVYGIKVEQTNGGAVTGEGATTIFFGPNTVDTVNHVASDIDFFNNNRTDVAFVKDEYWGDAASTATALADVALHEAGHTFGLYHVHSTFGQIAFAETMGWRYSNPQQFWVQDTAFLNVDLPEYYDQNGLPHGGGRGAQNSHRTMLENFGIAPRSSNGNNLQEPKLNGEDLRAIFLLDHAQLEEEHLSQEQWKHVSFVASPISDLIVGAASQIESRVKRDIDPMSQLDNRKHRDMPTESAGWINKLLDEVQIAIMEATPDDSDLVKSSLSSAKLVDLALESLLT